MPRAKRTRKPATTPSDLPVTVLALADLTPYPRNPRHITPAAVNAVAESLAAFGWRSRSSSTPGRSSWRASPVLDVDTVAHGG